MSFFSKSGWFLVGAGAGAGATWLFGTREGRRTRRQMVRAVHDSRDYLWKTGAAARDKGADLWEQGKEFVEDTREWVMRRAS